jgi:hypothetical protein
MPRNHRVGRDYLVHVAYGLAAISNRLREYQISPVIPLNHQTGRELLILRLTRQGRLFMNIPRVSDQPLSVNTKVSASKET